MKKSWILLSVALVSIFLGAVTLLTVTRLKQQQPIAPTVPEPQQAVEPACRVSFNLYPLPTVVPSVSPRTSPSTSPRTSPSISPTPGLCPVPGALALSKSCDAENNSATVTLTWTGVKGVIRYQFAIDNNSDFLSQEYSPAFSDSAENNGTLTRTFTVENASVPYYFRVRSQTSDGRCSVPSNWSNTVTMSACPGIGGPSPSPVLQCNQSCTTNAQCPSNLLCYIPAGQTNGNCRLPVCQTDTDCTCNPSPSPTVSPAPSVIPGVPKAGTSWPTIFLIVGGLALLVIGFALP